MEQEDLIEELYNQVIQEHSDLQYEYTEDELQDVIMDIVYKKLDELQKINTLSMISPVTNEEKQKLLESLTIKDKVDALENIISFYLHDVNFNNQTVQ